MVDFHIEKVNRHFDYVFVHGMVSEDELPHLMNLASNGSKIVWCVDDDYFSLPKTHHMRMNKKRKGCIYALSLISSAVIFSTNHLRDRFEEYLNLKMPLFVGPNLLDGSHYRVDWEQKRLRKKPLVAWFGCPNHDEDLKHLLPVFEELQKAKDSMDVTFFGSCHPEIRAKWGGSWVKEHNGVEFPGYPDAMFALSPDVSLCPLNEDPFALGRSDLKLKESMAIGSLVLFSPVGPFLNFPHGKPCLNTEDWLVSITSACKLFYTNRQGFEQLCRNSEMTAREEFFWGTCPWQKDWNDLLDNVLENS